MSFRDEGYCAANSWQAFISERSCGTRRRKERQPCRKGFLRLSDFWRSCLSAGWSVLAGLESAGSLLGFDRPRASWLVLLGCIFAGFPFLLTAETNESRATLTIHVGVVANATKDPRLGEVRERFTQLENYVNAATNRTEAVTNQVHFRIAYGGYNDVLSWARNGLIEMGLFSPAVWAIINSNKLDWQEVAVECLNNEPGKYYYQSVGVVPANSPTTNWNEIVDLLVNNGADLIATDPLSLSGYIAPVYYMFHKDPTGRHSSNDLKLLSVQFRFTHDETTNYFRGYVPGKSRIPVIFMRSPTNNDVRDAARISGCPLNEIWLPHSGIAVNSVFYATNKALIDKMFSHSPPNYPSWFGPPSVRNAHPKDESYKSLGDVWQWMRALHGGFFENWLIQADMEHLSLEDIGRLLVAYAEQSSRDKDSVQLRRMKIALVLSGGGAKCAFQVGAIQGIEKMLAGLRNLTNAYNEPKLFDISLVVGTSGGAVNAVPIARGATNAFPDNSNARNSELGKAWLGLSKWTIFELQPAAGIGLAIVSGTLALLIVLTVSWAFTLLRPNPGANFLQFWIAAAILVILSVSSLLVGLEKHRRNSWDAIWLDSLFWLRLAAVLITGLICLCLRRAYLKPPARQTGRMLTFGLLSVFAGFVAAGFLILLIIVFWGFPSLISPSGLAEELVRAYRPFCTGRENSKVEVSRHLACNLRRDLVITASSIEKNPRLPSDFYFYLPRQDSDDNYRRQFLRGSNWQPIPEDGLLDVVLGSGAIFPLFPPRPLLLQGQSQSVQLVDGGFAHNSPLEAATELDVTHIFLIEASKQEDAKVEGLLKNIALAFNHLHGEAQSSDVRARNTTVATVFALRPDQQRAELTEFQAARVGAAIDQGFEMAQKTNAWQRLPARPQFHD